MARLGFFLGSATSFSVRVLSSELGKMLASDFELDLIVTDKEPFEGVSDYFNFFGTSHPTTDFLVKDYGGALALQEYLANYEPDVVTQLVRPPIHGPISGILSSIKRTPFVYRYGGDSFFEYRVHQGWKKPAAFVLNNLVGRTALPFADRCISLGPSGKDRLVQRGVDPDNIEILPPALDPDRLDKDEGKKTTMDKSKTLVSFVGRMSRLKGLDLVESAIPKILDEREDIIFQFLGEPLQKPNIPEEYSDHVLFRGAVQPSEVSAYLKQSDLLIHPSLTEGLPRVCLEALYCGTPILASDVGDISSITSNLFYSEAEFVDKVLSLEDLPQDSVEEFTISSLQPKYKRFYDSLVK